jgi:hypothetical protein
MDPLKICCIFLWVTIRVQVALIDLTIENSLKIFFAHGETIITTSQQRHLSNFTAVEVCAKLVSDNKMARKTLLQSKSVSNLSPIRQHGLEVNISSFEEMDGGAYVNFVIETTKEGIQWEIRKRYSEFKFFQQALAEHTQHLACEFPSKTVIFVPSLSPLLRSCLDSLRWGN